MMQPFWFGGQTIPAGEEEGKEGGGEEEGRVG
jgi:hypothetical protein